MSSIFTNFVSTLEAPIPQHDQTHSNNLPTNCLSVFDHFVGLALERLKYNVDLLTSMSFIFSINLSDSLNLLTSTYCLYAIFIMLFFLILIIASYFLTKGIASSTLFMFFSLWCKFSLSTSSSSINEPITLIFTSPLFFLFFFFSSLFSAFRIQR